MVRYGVEVEGRFKGLSTLIVFTLADHRRVQSILEQHGRSAEHIWFELPTHDQASNFDWDMIEAYARHFKGVTVLIRKAADIPTYDLPANVCLVWKAPETLSPILTRVEYIQHASAVGVGMEFEKRQFVEKDYEGDEVWPS